MVVKTSCLTLVLAVVLVSAPTTLSHAEDCQAKLATAMLKVASSGPMRWTTKVIVNGEPHNERVVEVVPPSTTRDVTRSLVQGAELIKRKAELERVIMGKLDDNGSTKAYTDFGDDGKRSIELLLYQFLHSELYYFTTSCGANKIEFEFDLFSKAKVPDIEADKALGFARPVATGFVEIDSAGRPFRLVRGDYFPGPTMLAELKKSDPNDPHPVITSKTVEMSFTYDPGIKIEEPK
jgi:hypothetical protein